jgi:hypothetical protein
LLTLSAWIEVGAGLVLELLPRESLALVFGAALDQPAASTLARLAGAALLALGAACWFARRERNRAATGVVAAMTVYNVGAVLVFVCAAVSSASIGILLWPAVALHALLALWCVACLWSVRARAH